MEELLKWLPLIIQAIGFIIWIIRLESKVSRNEEEVIEMKELQEKIKQEHKEEIKEIKDGYKVEFKDIKSIIKDLTKITQNLSVSVAELKVIVTNKMSLKPEN